MNNLPVDILSARCPHGRIIASDVGMPFLATDLPPNLHSASGWKLLLARWGQGRSSARHMNLVDLLVGAACATSTRQLALVRGVIDCYIAPAVDDHATLSRRHGHDIDVMAERGYQAARAALDKLAES
jgi:hypothetical protein